VNRNKIKSYAPKARRDFIKAVTDRAAFYGLTKDKIDPVTVQGDVAIIGGKPFPKDVAEKRKWLGERINREGFEQVMEAMAYTWFNRFVAIRFMELHGYLEHGYRVLSTTNNTNDTNKGEKSGGNFIDSGLPEILVHAEHVDLPGLDREKVVELKLAGNRDEELYRMLLIAQCNALHKAMPFLFERIGGYTELLIPDNLLHSNSPVRNLANETPEEEWQEIEIIGWLYQFYISEKKAQVIGKVVKSEDIPAATQLFTPNWIVKYMVQNSLGAQWLATYPNSQVKGQMEYYIEPAEQTDEVKAQLAAITPDSLDPEELTLIDPACGSGHILVEAYELFKAIYQERGYRQRDLAKLILEKNLFGLDIDERAAQLTGFCLMMKGRADDRRLFDRGAKLNVMALGDSGGFDAEGLAKGVKLADYGLKPGDLTELKRLFEHATTFGSLIRVPEGLAKKLPAFKQLIEEASHGLFVSDALKRLGPLVQQAEMLAGKYDAVVANPPYMGAKFYCSALKNLVNGAFKAGKADLYGAFILQNIQLAKDNGHVGMITIPNWMFLSSFEPLRDAIFQDAPISSLVHNGRGVWGSDFGSCSFVLRRSFSQGLCGQFLRLFDKQGSVSSVEELERRFHANPRFSTFNSDFKKIPGSPVGYWLSAKARNTFERSRALSVIAPAKQGLATANNDRFVRNWSEVSQAAVDFCSRSLDEAQRSSVKWFPYNKGGEFRRWYGNQDHLVNWANNGAEIRNFTDDNGKQRSRPQNTQCYFQASVSWSDITSGIPSFRYFPAGFIYDVTGMSAQPEDQDQTLSVLAYANTPIVTWFIKTLNPTLHFQIGNFSSLPFLESAFELRDFRFVEHLISASMLDWNAYERSWDFQSLLILTASADPDPTLESSYTAWIAQNRNTITEMKRLEEENNRLFIDAYGLQDELTPDVPIEQITLTVNPAYRYGGKLSEKEQWTRFRQDTMKELISYAIGCMMGRYSLDAPGLIYAHSGNEGFDPGRYTTFPADEDGILPITDTEWFDDDVAHRLIEFISLAWDAEHLEDNLTFLADNLSPKKNESSRETLRRYLCDSFFKDHLQTYKKRPIYWLFSSGKQKAFQCLVYLHRINEGTLSRMRTEYVIPLQGKMVARIEQLSGDINAATSTAHRKKLEREKDKLVKQQAELQAFDEKLRHFADQRISLDLDDGVKVNYGKFGDLLAEVKAVTGKKAVTTNHTN